MVSDQARELRLFMAGCKFLSKSDRIYIRGLLRRFEIDRENSSIAQAESHSLLEVDLAVLAARLEAEKELAAIEADRYLNARTVELMDDGDRAVEGRTVAPEPAEGKASKKTTAGRPPAAEWRLKRLRAAAGSDPAYIERMTRFVEYRRLHTMIDKLQWALSRRGTLIDALIRRER